MVGQTAGGALGGGILLGIWGKERAIAYVHQISQHLIHLAFEASYLDSTKTAY